VHLAHELSAALGDVAPLREVVEQRDDVGEGTRHLLSREESAEPSLGLRGQWISLYDVVSRNSFEVKLGTLTPHLMLH